MMSEIEKIQDSLDGKYWRHSKRNNRNNRQRTNCRKNLQRSRQNPMILFAKDFQTERKSEPLSLKTETIDNAQHLPSISGIEKTQRQILFELSALRLSILTHQQQEQETRLDQLLQVLQMRQTSQFENEHDRPVSNSSFARFLNHFEQNISELRQSIESLRNTPNQNDTMILQAESLPNVQQVEEDLCANQLLMLRKESKTNPTMIEARRKFDANKGDWKWRAKSCSTQLPVEIDEQLSDQIEADYQNYFSKGKKTCAYPTKDLQREVLIHFDARRGHIGDEQVVFERTL